MAIWIYLDQMNLNLILFLRNLISFLNFDHHNQLKASLYMKILFGFDSWVFDFNSKVKTFWWVAILYVLILVFTNLERNSKHIWVKKKKIKRKRGTRRRKNGKDREGVLLVWSVLWIYEYVVVMSTEETRSIFIFWIIIYFS